MPSEYDEMVRGLREDSERKTQSFHLSIALVRTYKRVCAKLDVSNSKILEKLIRDFIEQNSGALEKKSKDR